MERLNEYLRNLTIESLMDLSRESESITFEEKSIVRHLIFEYEISSEFYNGLLALRCILLTEITRRYFGSLK